MTARSLIPIPAGGAALLAVAVYLNALDNPFVFDDFRPVVQRASLIDAWNLQPVIVEDRPGPVVSLSYALDAMLWDRRAAGYHAFNLLLHGANVVLVYWLALFAADDSRRRRAAQGEAPFSPPVVAVAAALLFATHPLLTQAVSFVSGRAEVIYATFVFGAVLAARQWMTSGGRAWWVSCMVLWTVAVLTNVSATVVPFLLIAYDRLLLDPDPAARRRRWLQLELPLLGATVVAALPLLAVESGVRLEWRLALVHIEAFGRYLALLVVPVGQSIFHMVTAAADPGSSRALGAAAVLSGFLVVSWLLRREHPLLTLGLAWFAVALVPSAVLSTVGRGEPLAEHRAYLAAAGLFLAAAGAFGILWTRAVRWRNPMIAAGILCIAALSVMTIVRNGIWHDPILLAREVVAVAPAQGLSRILAADALRHQGRCAETIREYTMAIALQPFDERGYTRLARCFLELGSFGDAERVLRQLRTSNPQSHDASLGLAVLNVLLARPEESRRYLENIPGAAPGNDAARTLLGLIDGTLPADERVRTCDRLHAIVAARPVRIQLCEVADRS